jgi:hypothetical protein
MKRKIALVTFSLFAALACLALETPQASAQARRGKALVTQLPEGSQGVVLRSNAVRLRRGFKFVKHRNGTVSLARISAGSSGAGGSWSCNCKPTKPSDPPKGSCETMIVGGALLCRKGTCTSSACELVVTINGLTTGVILY